MITLQLTLDNGQVTVLANELRSHSFSIRDLDNTNLKNFVNDPKPYGAKLFQALFQDGSEAHKVFDELSKQTERTIVLVLESTELDSIAWEYAHHNNAYVVEDFAFIRVLPEKERPHSNVRLSKNVERLPLLFIPANPLVDLNGEPMRELDIENEWREMTEHIVRSNAPFDLIELRPATPAALQSVMARFQNGMIAHFSGHGAVTKDGAFLLFENENGASNPLEAREFVREVKDQAWISFLSACQSAVAERTEYSNLARELVKAGVPFALGMQFNLPDPFAPNISGQFYNYLSQGHAVPEAARQARRAVKRENEFYVGVIALYAAHPDEAGKMQWSGSGARTLPTFAAADVSDLPTPSGFIGRQRELMNIGTNLLGKKKTNTVTLHGAGGIGKTALMRQALLRFAPSFEAALAIALDPLPSLESVLGRLERFLNLPSPSSNDTKEREQIVRGKLTSKRTLLGLDNFETLNYALNEKGSDEEKTSKSLHAFFKSLAANGVTLCVTSREVTNLPGETIEDIQGLTNENGGRLFQENVVRQKDEIFIKKTQQVSEMVGGHPLALRLLASAFDNQVRTSLDQYIKDLQSHLPKARDKWTEEDRHESLRASFDFTMNNLLKTKDGEKLQIALSRLSVFVSFFPDILAAPVLENHFPEKGEERVEMIPRASNILHALWEHGLLERVPISLIDDPYYLYSFHPALRFFAKEKLKDIKSVQDNYLISMDFMARLALEQIDKSPLIARITSSAMPDLLAAAEARSDKDAAKMQFCVSQLLEKFGLFDDALRLLGIFRKTNEFSENLQGESLALHEIANIYEKRGDLDKAMNLYQQSLEIKKRLGDLKGKSATMEAIADIYMTRGDLDRAMNLYQQSLEIKERLGDLNGKIYTLPNMANIYVRRGNLDEALKLYQQSLEIQEARGEHRGKISILINMANIFVSRGQIDESLSLYYQSLEIAEAFGDLSRKLEAVGCIAKIEALRGNLSKAIEMLQKKLPIIQEIGNQGEILDTLTNLATIILESGDIENAMKLYQQSLEIAEDLGDLYIKSAILHNMGQIYIMRDDLDLAVRLYQQALEIKEHIGDLKGKSATLHQIASIYFKLDKLDEAINLYQQSLEIKEALGVTEGKSETLGMMGQILWAKGAHGKAIGLLLSGLMLLVQLKLEPQTQQAMISILIRWRQELGEKRFNVLWQEEIGQPMPEWLTPLPEKEQSTTIEQFIMGALRSAREKRPEAEGHFKEAQKMAIDSNAPAELQSLGKILQRIMIGEKNVDLSTLSSDLREMIERALEG